MSRHSWMCYPFQSIQSGACAPAWFPLAISRQHCSSALHLNSLTSSAGSQPESSSQLKPLTQLAAQQPQVLNDIVSQPAVWIAYSPLALILMLVLLLLRASFFTSVFGSAVSTSICVLYAAQQRLLLGRQEQIAVMRARKAVVGGLASQQDAMQSDKADRAQPSTQILLTLLGAEITDSLTADGEAAQLLSVPHEVIAASTLWLECCLHNATQPCCLC